MTNNIKSNKGRVPGQSRENRFISAVQVKLLQQENISNEEAEAQPFNTTSQSRRNSWDETEVLVQHKLDFFFFVNFFDFMWALGNGTWLFVCAGVSHQ